MTWRACLAVAFGTVLVLAGAGEAGAAQAGTDPGATGTTAVIEGLDGIADEAAGVAVDARVANQRLEPVADVRLRITVHDRTRSRYGLAEALDEGSVGPGRQTTETAHHELDAGEERDLVLRVPPAELGLQGAAPGVYPATIAVVDEHGTGAEHVTALVVPPAQGEPVRLAVLLELRGPVATAEAGPHGASAVATSAERAQRIAEELRRPLPATIAIDGRTTDELRAVASGEQAPSGPPELIEGAQTALDALAEVTSRGRTEVVAMPYGPADLVALNRAEMGGEARHLVDLGKATAELAASSGTRAGSDSDIVIPASGLDAPTAGWLSGVATGTVLTESDLGLPLDRDLPSTPPAVRTLSGIPGLPVAVPDPLLTDSLARTSPQQGPALAAQRVLAETAAAFFERPGGSTPRGIVLAPPSDRLPELLPTLARQLPAASWLEPVTLTELLDAVPASGAPESLAYGANQRRAELPTAYLLSIRDARRRLEPLAGILGEEAVADHARRLDAVSAVGFRGRPLRDRGEAIIAVITDTAREVRRAVTVVDAPPLTLTGTQGAVPVTLANAADAELTVRVRLLTPRYDVEDADGRDVVLPADGEITTTFDVEALAPGGTYPLTVEVTAPDEQMGLAAGRVVVRSTAISITGVVITGGAVLLLVGWAAHALARRRARPTDGDGEAAHGRSETETTAPGGAR